MDEKIYKYSARWCARVCLEIGLSNINNISLAGEICNNFYMNVRSMSVLNCCVQNIQLIIAQRRQLVCVCSFPFRPPLIISIPCSTHLVINQLISKIKQIFIRRTTRLICNLIFQYHAFYCHIMCGKVTCHEIHTKELSEKLSIYFSELKSCFPNRNLYMPKNCI